MSDLEQYRASEKEHARTADILRVLPKGRRSVLDVGARDGHFSRLLTEYFTEVTALDLQRPCFEFTRVVTIAGDATKLDFAADSFDCVFCAEVLEHIPDLQSACREIVRVAKHEIIVGVPFRQDIRIGRTTCHCCGRANPPWGHVNYFDDDRLARLFSGLRVISKSFVGVTKEATNPLSAFLMDLAGNPWGSYDQEEPCIHCGAKLVPPENRKIWRKVCSAIAARANRVQTLFTRPYGTWIHLVFSKRGD
jgi:Methylase involved in ubiquinone/menaquinone biosynthesis